MDNSRNRQPKGTTVGGQFAASQNPESNVDLVERDVDAPLVLGQPFHRERRPYERVVGEKYEQGLDTAEIAKRMRQEIKSALSRGDLPTDADISVTSERFAGGSAINIKVHNWPGATVPEDDSKCDGVRNCNGPRKHDWRCPGAEHPSEEAERVQGVLQAIHDSYNYDGSDVMSDYFSVNYYGQVRVEPYRPPLVAPGLAPLNKTGSLAELKRAVQVGTVLEVTQHPHWPAIVGVKRAVSDVKSGSIALRTPKEFDRSGRTRVDFDSSVDWGRASDVVFDKTKNEFSIGDIRYRIVPSSEESS